jgi:4-amino-4-deoxy-L-arabinose transferase-like glycosyltransferase
MQIQKALSVLISVFTIVPTYYLCKKFVPRKFALIGASFVAFDPRLTINSFLGVADPLYLILMTTSLTLFLYSNKKIFYFSFVFVALATIVRSEGMILFIALSLMFFIRYRKEKYKVIFRYLIVLAIFILIILPISLYRIEVIAWDGIFMRSIVSGDSLTSNLITSDNSKNNIVSGLEIFIKYSIWVLIPNFIIFIPLGLFLIFRNRNFEKNTIILSAGLMVVPAFYAYSIPALDTRYLYVLFPLFAVLSILSIEKIYEKLNKPNIFVIIIIVSIIASSVIFYDQVKIDSKHEKESFEIMKKISHMINGTNVLYQESSYFQTIQTVNEWPNKYTQIGLNKKFDITVIPIDNFDSLKNYLIETKDKGLTHIIVDDKKERQSFLVDIFDNEDNYPYLEKIYDSEIDGFSYHVKVFKINYELFNSLKTNVIFK